MTCCRFALHVFPPVVLALSGTATALADSRIAARYTIGGQNSETTVLNKGPRQRLEMGPDLVLVRQTDLKRSLQIHEKDKTFEIVPDSGAEAKVQRQGGVVEVTTTVVQTGQTKKMFGQTARHLKTTVERNPLVGACEMKRLKTETDGWYIDLPVPPPPTDQVADCVDEIREKTIGKSLKLGFPVQYTMTTTEEGAEPVVLTMEVTALETAALEAALFDAPAGFRETQRIGGVVAAAGSKVPGMMRIGIAPFGNPSGSSLPPEAFQQQLIGQLSKPGIEALPVSGSTRADAESKARDRQCDYLLAADLAEFKKSTAGKVGGLLNRASALTSRNGGNPNENIEARIDYQLIPLNGGTALNASVSNKTGGINLRQTVQLAMTVAQFASPFAMLNPRMFQMLQTMRSMQGGTGMGAGMGMNDPGLGGMMMMFRQSQSSTAPPAISDEGAVVTAAIQRVSKAVLETVQR